MIPIIKKPTIKHSKTDKHSLSIEAIEQTDECTILYFASETTKSPAYYSINEFTYIRDTKTGIKYPLLATENCSITNVTMPSLYKDGKARFQLCFPKLPESTLQIDFIEPNESDWKIYGIKLK